MGLELVGDRQPAACDVDDLLTLGHRGAAQPGISLGLTHAAPVQAPLIAIPLRNL